MSDNIAKKTPIVFMGTPEFAVTTLKRLVEEGYNIAGVVTVPDKPSGRGLKMNISDVKEYALTLNVPIMQPVSLKEPAFLEQLQSLHAEIFVVVAFKMLPKIVWSMPRLGTFNLHASLLPKYRGAAPINWAIINGETISGVTTFLLDEKIDTGAIIYQEQCTIEDGDNIGTLYDKLMYIGSRLVLKTVDTLVNGSFVAIPQEVTDLSLLPSAPKITKETGSIKWSAPASVVRNLIRGLSPYPAAHSSIVSPSKTLDIKIFGAELSSVSFPIDAPSGSVKSDCKSFLAIRCGSCTSLNITELQVAGKKRLSIKEFLAGWHDDWSQCYFK